MKELQRKNILILNMVCSMQNLKEVLYNGKNFHIWIRGCTVKRQMLKHGITNQIEQVHVPYYKLQENSNLDLIPGDRAAER